MAIDQLTAQEDLAFLRAIVDERSPAYKATGYIYGAAGILYGLQCLVTWLHMAGILVLSGEALFMVSILPTVFFFILLFWVLWRSRKEQRQQGIASRAIEAVFSGAGFANLVMALVFGFASWQRQDFSIWLFYPVVVCAFQGAVWYVVAMIRKRMWMWVTAAGWFGTALVAGFFTQNPANYLLVLSIGLFAFMAIPGIIMVRTQEDAA